MVKELKNRLDGLIMEYVALFEKKHEMQFDFWVGDDVGDVGMFGDFYVDFRTIRFDIENDIEESLFIRWYDESLLNHENGKTVLNYETYVKVNK